MMEVKSASHSCYFTPRRSLQNPVNKSIWAPETIWTRQWKEKSLLLMEIEPRPSNVQAVILLSLST
jgi:hypothetical protein